MHRIIRMKEVTQLTGKSRTQVWRDVRAKRFPVPRQLGPNAIGWFDDEIENWLSSRPRVAYAPETGEDA